MTPCRLRVLLAAALLAASVGAAEVPDPSRQGPRVSEQLLLLVTLDTTRADRLGAWGGPAKTPSLDRLAAESLRFARCEASSPLTLPSHATILTGLEPPEHGVRDNGPWCLERRHETIAESLSRAGWTTAAVVSAAVLARARGLDQGFDRYVDDVDQGSGSVPERTADATTDLALGLLDGLDQDGAPSFLWVHYFDPHFPYRPPGTEHSNDDHATSDRAAYDSELAFLDVHLGRLLESLPPDAAVVVVGDHGEMLGDGGEPRHGLLPGDGVRHVPLIVRRPDRPSRGPGGVPNVVSDLVRTADIAPTLLELAGLPSRRAGWGRSVLGLLDGRPDPPRLAYWETFFPYFAYGWSPLRAMSDGERLAVRSLADADHPATGDLARRLHRYLDDVGESFDRLPVPGCRLAPGEREALQALGYVSSGRSGTASDKVSDQASDQLSDQVSGTLRDPRRHVDTAVFLQRAAALVAHCGSGAEDPMDRLIRIVEDDASNATARELAARCRLARGEAAGALELLAGEDAPEQPGPVLLTLLGDVHSALGHEADARSAWRRGLALDPAESRSAVQLARSLRTGGDPAAAEAVIEELVASGGITAEAVFERGMARVARVDTTAALDDFLAASRRTPPGPLRIAPLLNAADLAERLGRDLEARRALRELVRLLPSRADLRRRLERVEQQLDD